jgi:hypothetical protein
MDKPDSPAPANPSPVAESAERRAEAAPAAEVAEGKTERIASMRHELLELQRHLLEAQQRITTELQGRAEDADRFEALEARAREHEGKVSEGAARLSDLTIENTSLRSQSETDTKALEVLRGELEARETRLEESITKVRELTEQLEQHATSLRDTKALLATRDAEIASTASERESHQSTTTRLHSEIEAALAKQRELAEQLDTHTASLQETKRLLAERESEVATRTTERDALHAAKTKLESDLEDTRRMLDVGRGKAQELAKQLTSFGNDLLDAVVVADPRGGASARASAESPRAPSKPPPIPPARPPRTPTPAPGETPLIAKPIAATPAAKPQAASRGRGWLLVVGGMAAGAGLAFAIMELAAATPPAENPPREVSAMTPAPSVVEEGRPTAAAGDAGAQTSDAAADPDRFLAPGDAGAAIEPSPVDAQRSGIIVLPAEADRHRVFVDGHRVDPKNGRVEVSCGKHELQIGSRGEPRTLDVSCDGETEVR